MEPRNIGAQIAPYLPKSSDARGLLALTVLALVIAMVLFVRLVYLPHEVRILVGTGTDRAALAAQLGDALDWTDVEQASFASVYAQMQWAAFNDELDSVLTERFSWSDNERERFLTNSTRYLDPSLDILSDVHEPGTYTFTNSMSTRAIAQAFIERVEAAGDDELEEYIAERLAIEPLGRVATFVSGEVELLPDLVPLPAQDLILGRNGDSVLLSFTTVYYNRGAGPLELRADADTAGIAEDIEREVYQRIYRANGTFREHVAGTFLWHQEHLHYHFSDFIEYDLEPVDVPDDASLEGSRVKSTFCIRDVSRVELEFAASTPTAAYEICGKEVQGISVGWGDAYFYNYPDQNLNLTGLPSGTYRLTFIVNPDERFEEEERSNNTASVLLVIDMEALTVEVLSTAPSDYPSIEHVYPEQDCSNCTL